MILYHYTAARNLRGIAKHGLTVGDVPTDLRNAKGRVGVWLTSSPESTGHGLSGPKISSSQYRLTVDLPSSMDISKWDEWAPGNATAETIKNLKTCAEGDGSSQWQTWFIRFGVIPRTAIVACYDMISERDVRDWAEIAPVGGTMVMIPAWRREAWHKHLLKHHARYLRGLDESGIPYTF